MNQTPILFSLLLIICFNIFNCQIQSIQSTHTDAQNPEKVSPLKTDFSFSNDGNIVAINLANRTDFYEINQQFVWNLVKSIQQKHDVVQSQDGQQYQINEREIIVFNEDDSIVGLTSSKSQAFYDVKKSYSPIVKIHSFMQDYPATTFVPKLQNQNDTVVAVSDMETVQFYTLGSAPYSKEKVKKINDQSLTIDSWYPQKIKMNKDYNNDLILTVTELFDQVNQYNYTDLTKIRSYDYDADLQYCNDIHSVAGIEFVTFHQKNKKSKTIKTNNTYIEVVFSNDCTVAAIIDEQQVMFYETNEYTMKSHVQTNERPAVNFSHDGQLVSVSVSKAAQFYQTKDFSLQKEMSTKSQANVHFNKQNKVVGIADFGSLNFYCIYEGRIEDKIENCFQKNGGLDTLSIVLIVFSVILVLALIGAAIYDRRKKSQSSTYRLMDHGSNL